MCFVFSSSTPPCGIVDGQFVGATHRVIRIPCRTRVMWQGGSECVHFLCLVLAFRWEMKRTADGRPYYVDHNTKTTSWVRPASGPKPRVGEYVTALQAPIEHRTFLLDGGCIVFLLCFEDRISVSSTLRANARMSVVRRITMCFCDLSVLCSLTLYMRVCMHLQIRTSPPGMGVPTASKASLFGPQHTDITLL